MVKKCQRCAKGNKGTLQKTFVAEHTHTGNCCSSAFFSAHSLTVISSLPVFLFDHLSTSWIWDESQKPNATIAENLDVKKVHWLKHGADIQSIVFMKAMASGMETWNVQKQMTKRTTTVQMEHQQQQCNTGLSVWDSALWTSKSKMNLMQQHFHRFDNFGLLL